MENSNPISNLEHITSNYFEYFHNHYIENPNISILTIVYNIVIEFLFAFLTFLSGVGSIYNDPLFMGNLNLRVSTGKGAAMRGFECK